MGVASFGMGVGDYFQAGANSINTDTAIRLNEYVYESLLHENKMSAERRTARAEREKELYGKTRERIMKSPEASDVDKGDALNSILDRLNGPTISESALKYEAIPLSVRTSSVSRSSWPKKESEASRCSGSRPRNAHWPVAFQDTQFAGERRGL